MTNPKEIAALSSVMKMKTKNVFPLNTFCFKEQLNFINDQSKFKTAVCGRRSGKTIACAADLLSTALSNDRMVCLYITLSRQNAKRIIWNELDSLCTKYAIWNIKNNTELSLRLGNRSMIYLSGAKDKTSIDNFRGMALKKVYIDEVQSFRPYIEDLVEDVISKALYDHDGSLCLTGTPGPVPVGYFYNCAHAEGWGHHGWTMYQNPFLSIKSGRSHDELLKRDLSRKGITIEHPTIQREVFGRWVTDTEALVFKYDSQKNHYETCPQNSGKYEYVIGMDLGFNDSDAIAVLGWNQYRKEVYLVNEVVTRKQTITSLMEQLAPIVSEYNPNRIVCDTGGLGRKITEEMSARWGIPIMAAEKVRKHEFIELLNDSMRTSRFFAKRETKFAQDCNLLEWEVKPSGNREVSNAYHSDITDAVLYGFRECLHWLSEPEPLKPVINTPEWFAEQERNHIKKIEEDLIKEKNATNIDDPWDTNGEWEV
jgi:phage terminase large subunit